ncbi:hypothetical protein ACQW5G_04040 [Fructilactobacillus sp. Tb1]|uniref:hypothetical protein n=1 Tax=Fructilactobacillus sp. Tb1 TaxID=3422304 RepID=UPI003D27096F
MKSKEKFADEFLNQVSAKPLSDITIKGLCDESGLSRKTFYNNFDSFADLMNFTNIYVNRYVWSAFSKNSQKANTLTDIIKIFPVALYENRDKLKVMYTSDLRGRWLKYLHDKYHDWAMENVFKDYHSDKMPKEMACFIFCQSLISALDYWISSPIPDKPEIFSQYLLTIMATAPFDIPKL